uniref:Secreted protein n=1 Tax=Anopheles darlingi TaxID=43151 RepID=A0A2M4DCJ1_ANODA
MLLPLPSFFLLPHCSLVLLLVPGFFAFPYHDHCRVAESPSSSDVVVVVVVLSPLLMSHSLPRGCLVT